MRSVNIKITLQTDSPDHPEINLNIFCQKELYQVDPVERFISWYIVYLSQIRSPGSVSGSATLAFRLIDRDFDPQFRTTELHKTIGGKGGFYILSSKKYSKYFTILYSQKAN